MNVPSPKSSSSQERVSVSHVVNPTSTEIGNETSRLMDTKHGDRWSSGNEMDLIYSPVATELAAVESVIRNEIQTDTPWVARLLEHNWIQGGKRIRPVLLLLSGASTGQLSASHIQLAAAIELIHAATLVHDDVIDKAEMRRHLPTVNSTWGNRASVLLGDFLFTHAFYVASLAGRADAIKAISKSSNRVCEGEIRQNAWQGHFELAEQDYLAMIQDKTGELCRCSCLVGAMLSGASDALAYEYGQYGLKLGVAFQIIDDILDLIGQQPKIGKTLGTDLSNQKPTLPILHSLSKLQGSARTEFLDRLKANTDHSVDIIATLNQTGSIGYAYQMAEKHLDDALQFAKSLPRSDSAAALQRLVSFVLKRAH